MGWTPVRPGVVGPGTSGKAKAVFDGVNVPHVAVE